jgi:hypothetical protein
VRVVATGEVRLIPEDEPARWRRFRVEVGARRGEEVSPSFRTGSYAAELEPL